MSGTVSGIFGKVFDFAKGAAFQAALPANVARWAPMILKSAQKYNVDPWVLASIMFNESRGGEALTPKNDPAGTGDFIPRTEGQVGGSIMNKATGLPPDGKGWGRGLMQIDYGVHYDWVTKNAWWDPQVNIDKGAQILAEMLAVFRKSPNSAGIKVEAWRLTRGIPKYGILPWPQKYPGKAYPQVIEGQKYAATPVKDVRPLSGAQLYEAAVAAYNAGSGGVLQALGLGLPAEAPTSTQQYVTNFAARIATWMAKFK